jgi:hypothetical protein
LKETEEGTEEQELLKVAQKEKQAATDAEN